MLKWNDPQGSTYYKAILQNLFFATLNTDMERDRPGSRRFRGKAANGGRDQHFGISNVYRYADYFTDPAAALDLFADIPFLNGGLFDCLDRAKEGVRVDGFSERTDNPLRVPDDLFFGGPRDVDLNDVYATRSRRYEVRGLLRIFDSYKFTIEENTPIEEEIALDPELLGKVFENLLANFNPETGATARKQTGSFYTPRPIVDYMVDESLLAYLETAFAPQGDAGSRGRLRRLLAYTDEPHDFSPDEAARLVAAIDHVKVLDPACGSGAFPMGMLHKLVYMLGKLDPDNTAWRTLQRQKAVRETDEAYRIGDREERQHRLLDIEEAFDRNSSDYGRKLYLIENCIYGVDIQPIAVQIAKLRFFISLVVDQQVDDARPNRGIRPLPNLETKFVAANTLIGIPRPAQMALRNPTIEEQERELAEVRRRHFAARTPATKEKYRREDERLRGGLAELLRQDGWDNATAAQLAGWDPYNQNTHADFFDPEWMFGVKDGFDIVIGNPPYVRQEQLGAQKPVFQQQYTCYTGTADLYVYFYERGLRLLAEGGVLVYISSNKYFRAGYGTKLRGYLSREARIEQLIDFGDAPVFTAIAYPSIILLRRGAGADQQTRSLTWPDGEPLEDFAAAFCQRSFLLAQRELTADGWRLEAPSTLRLLEKLRRAGQPLGEYVGGQLYYGIKTGLNEAFVVDRATRDRLIAEHPSSADVLKPFLRGRDVKRWRVDYQHLWLIFTRRSIDIQNYPAILRYLSQYEDRLYPGIPGGRKPGSYSWYEIQDSIAYWQEFSKPKIVIPAISANTAYAPDWDEHYTNDKTSICVTDSVSYLLGLLNSNLLWWFIRQTAATRQGGFYEFKPMYVSQLPVVPTRHATPVEDIVDRILVAKRADPVADVSALEHEIDQLVYRLYGLTAEEIKIVEGAGAM